MNLINLIANNKNISLVGGGGKTGFIQRLAMELWQDGRPALVTVTTRLGRGQLPGLAPVEAGSLQKAVETARRALEGERLLLAGPFQADNVGLDKFSGLPLSWFGPLREAAGPNLILLIEADGSAGRPLKCHRADEPVLPALDNFVVAVVGLSVLFKPWPEAVHRPEILTSIISVPQQDRPLSPAQVAEYIGRAWRRFQPDLIFLNQTDLLTSEREVYLARELAELLRKRGWPVAGGSVQQNRLFRF